MDDYLKTAERVMTKYKTHEEHVRHVAGMADWLFVHLRELHGLPDEARQELQLAAYLHDIGHMIGEKHHHRHSCYLILSDEELQDWEQELRARVAYAALHHRKKKHQAWDWGPYGQWHPQSEEQPGTRLSAVTGLLRLADVLDYEHKQQVKLQTARYLPEERLVLLELEGMELTRYERKLHKKLRWAAWCWSVDFVVSCGQERIILLRQ